MADGWRVATIWECALRKPHMVNKAAGLVGNWLLSEEVCLEIGATDLE